LLFEILNRFIFFPFGVIHLEGESVKLVDLGVLIFFKIIFIGDKDIFVGDSFGDTCSIFSLNEVKTHQIFLIYSLNMYKLFSCP
jgi:hypothetical protein